MVINQAKAEEYLSQDVAWAEEAVRTKVKVKLTQNQFDALVSFVFNVGATNFSTSTLLKRLNEGRYQEAANELLRWVRQKGIVLRGLQNRRREERALFLFVYQFRRIE
jgi:lysozyme